MCVIVVSLGSIAALDQWLCWIASLRRLVPRCETRLGRLTPEFGKDTPYKAGPAPVAACAASVLKPPPTATPQNGDAETVVEVPSTAKIDPVARSKSPASADALESKRRAMEEYAAAGDFIEAGKLQGEMVRLEDLQRQVKCVSGDQAAYPGWIVGLIDQTEQ